MSLLSTKEILDISECYPERLHFARAIETVILEKIGDPVEQLRQKDEEIKKLKLEVHNADYERNVETSRLEGEVVDLRQALVSLKEIVKSSVGILQMVKEEIHKTMGEVNLYLLREDICSALGPLEDVCSALKKRSGPVVLIKLCTSKVV